MQEMPITDYQAKSLSNVELSRWEWGKGDRSLKVERFSTASSGPRQQEPILN